MSTADVHRTVKLSLCSFTHKYSGETDSNKFRNGKGTEFWKHDTGHQKYNGSFLQNCFHGCGTYTWNYDNKNYSYEGNLFSNNLEGYGVLSYTDGKIFEGLFSYNRRYGPGVLTYSDGTQDVGLWSGDNLIRLNQAASIGIVPQLTNTPKGKAYILQYKNLVPIRDELNSETETIRNQLKSIDDSPQERNEVFSKFVRNPNSSFFNKKLFFDSFFHNELDFTVDVTENGNLVKQVEVTHLLAWNNEELPTSIMKHSFRHRNSETSLSYRVPNLLTGQRQLFRSPGTHETACLNLLQSSCHEDENEIIKLICVNDLYPDLADSLGNTGVTFAAALDKLNIIKTFVDFGANVDNQNDECLTPLLLCILRYIALKNEVVDWEKAFLPTFVAKENKCEVQEWRSREISDLNVNRKKEGLQKYLFNLECVYPDIKDTLKGKKSRLINKNRDKENVSIRSIKGNEKLSISSKNSKKLDRKRTIDSTKDKLEPEAENAVDKLSQKIINTVLTLLQCGANPNYGSVPHPPLILSLFTEKVELLSMLLQFGANCNITSSDHNGSLTPLHIIASIPPFPELSQMAQILLENDADPNKLCNIGHWPEEKDILLAKTRTVDSGKTPLHLLCMRYDFEEDLCDHLGELLTTLLNHGTDVRIMYLGHSALSLAIIRGNVKLIQRILRTSLFDPNESLGNRMGVPLTVLALKRYIGILPLHVCEDVYNILLEFYANPLNLVEGFDGNTVEFAISDNTSMEIYEESIEKDDDSKYNKRENKKKTDKRNKGSQNEKSYGKGKSIKGKMNAGNEKVVQILRNCAFKTLVKYLKTKALKFLYDYKFQCEIDDPIFDNLVKFVDVHDAAKVLQILISNKKIYIDKRLCYETLQYVNNQAATKKNSKKRGRNKLSRSSIQPTIEVIFDSLDFNGKEVEKDSPFKVYMPEIDPEEEKYKVCFECLKKTNLELILCPKCELVYFCSQRCNIASNKKETVHRCNILFYESEREKIRKLLENGEMLHSRLAGFKKQKEIIEKTPRFIEKLKQRERTEFVAASLKDSFGEQQTKRSKSGKKSTSKSEKSKSRSKSKEKSVKKKKKGENRSSSDDSETSGKKKETRPKSRKREKSKSRLKSNEKSVKKKKKGENRSSSGDSETSGESKKRRPKSRKREKSKSRSKSKEKSVKKKKKWENRSSSGDSETSGKNKKRRSKSRKREKLETKMKRRRSKSKSRDRDTSQGRKNKRKLKSFQDDLGKSRKQEDLAKSRRQDRSESRKRDKDQRTKNRLKLPVGDKSRSEQQKLKSKETEKNNDYKKKRDKSKVSDKSIRSSSKKRSESRKKRSKSRSKLLISGKSRSEKPKTKSKKRETFGDSKKKRRRSKSKISDKSTKQETKAKGYGRDRSRTRDGLRTQAKTDSHKKIPDKVEKSRDYPELDQRAYRRTLGEMRKGIISEGYLDLVPDICEFNFKFYEMFMPYCVFIDGQLYYKFGDANAFCQLTYSNV